MLKDELKSLPNSPGVYQYFDKNGKLLYVGKAKVLKNRVKSYFAFTPNLAPSPRLGPRIAKMISEAVHIEWIATSSEADALILENSFIKQLRPKYNILLKDAKGYSYIRISNEKWRKITYELQKKDDGATYIGPYKSSFYVKQSVEEANRIFKLIHFIFDQSISI